MLDNALKILKKINDNGYEAYIVGGFVRDTYLKKASYDIDICTSALPNNLRSIFKDNIITDEKYGLTKITIENNVYEITTFRKDIAYLNHRKPSEIKYVNSLEEDLKRRDFTINTLCMDKNGKIIDLYCAKKDINNRIIKSVGDANIRFNEDSLRMLRAIRFACELNFKLDENVVEAIKKNSKFLLKLSYARRKEELDKIFCSDNYKYGLELISKFKLEKYLQINKIDNIKKTTNILGMWAQIEFSEFYPFTKDEKNTIYELKNIIYHGKIDSMMLYKYGKSKCFIGAEILEIDKNQIEDIYRRMQIHNKNEIELSVIEISELLKIENYKSSKILKEIEYKIIEDEIKNTKKEITSYVINKYGKEKYEG